MPAEPLVAVETLTPHRPAENALIARTSAVATRNAQTDPERPNSTVAVTAMVSLVISSVPILGGATVGARTETVGVTAHPIPVLHVTSEARNEMFVLARSVQNLPPRLGLPAYAPEIRTDVPRSQICLRSNMDSPKRFSKEECPVCAKRLRG